jgi:hypothetical protein
LTIVGDVAVPDTRHAKFFRIRKVYTMSRYRLHTYRVGGIAFEKGRTA